MAPPEKIYAWETLGSLAGGIAALLLPLLQPSSMVLPYFPAALWPLLLMSLLNKNISKTGIIAASSLMIVILFSGFLPRTDSAITETPQGRLQRTVYEGDTLYRLGAHFLPSPQYRPEEASQLHFALMEASSRPRLLLIGTLNLSLLADATKYQPQCITWLDTSPFITRLILQQSGRQIPAGITILPFSLQQMHGLKRKYDVLIVMNGEPSSLESSRWLTEEFIQGARQVLAPGGILCLNLPAVANYYSGELLQIYGSVANMLRHHFSHFSLIAATGTYALASDRPLDISMKTGLEKAGQYSDFVNPWFFNADELSRRSAELSASLPRNIHAATVNRPIVLALYQGYWIHLNQAKPISILAGLLLLIGLAMRRSARNDRLMFAVSFVTSSLQLVLLFLFQAVTGKIYLTAGLFFALFMAGLAFGSMTETRYLPRYHRPMLSLIVIALLSPAPFLMTKHAFLPEIFYGLWAALSLVAAGWITGYYYRLYSLREASGAARLYASDLAGGATGSLLTTLALVPLTGISGTLGILLLISLMVLLFTLIHSPTHPK
jgi:hypothetical protein